MLKSNQPKASANAVNHGAIKLAAKNGGQDALHIPQGKINKTIFGMLKSKNPRDREDGLKLLSKHPGAAKQVLHNGGFDEEATKEALKAVCSDSKSLFFFYHASHHKIVRDSALEMLNASLCDSNITASAFLNFFSFHEQGQSGSKG